MEKIHSLSMPLLNFIYLPTPPSPVPENRAYKSGSTSVSKTAQARWAPLVQDPAPTQGPSPATLVPSPTDRARIEILTAAKDLMRKVLKKGIDAKGKLSEEDHREVLGLARESLEKMRALNQLAQQKPAPGKKAMEEAKQAMAMLLCLLYIERILDVAVPLDETMRKQRNIRDASPLLHLQEMTTKQATDFIRHSLACIREVPETEREADIVFGIFKCLVLVQFSNDAILKAVEDAKKKTYPEILTPYCFLRFAYKERLKELTTLGDMLDFLNEKMIAPDMLVPIYGFALDVVMQRDARLELAQQEIERMGVDVRAAATSDEAVADIVRKNDIMVDEAIYGAKLLQLSFFANVLDAETRAVVDPLLKDQKSLEDLAAKHQEMRDLRTKARLAATLSLRAAVRTAKEFIKEWEKDETIAVPSDVLDRSNRLADEKAVIKELTEGLKRVRELAQD